MPKQPTAERRSAVSQPSVVAIKSDLLRRGGNRRSLGRGFWRLPRLRLRRRSRCLHRAPNVR